MKVFLSCLCFILGSGLLIAQDTDRPKSPEAIQKLLEKGGKHWSSKEKQGDFAAGKVVWVWPVEDRVFVAKQELTIKVNWVLRPGQKAPDGSEMWGVILVDGRAIIGRLKGWKDGVTEGTAEFSCKADELSGEGTVPFLVGPSGPAGIFVPKKESPPNGNILLLKVKVKR